MYDMDFSTIFIALLVCSLIAIGVTTLLGGYLIVNFFMALVGYVFGWMFYDK